MNDTVKLEKEVNQGDQGEGTPLDKRQVDEFYRVTGETCRTVIAIIDALCQRGGFKGEEMLSAGQIRQNCMTLVQMSETHASIN